jgi:hypothetical protein
MRNATIEMAKPFAFARLLDRSLAFDLIGVERSGYSPLLICTRFDVIDELFAAGLSVNCPCHEFLNLTPDDPSCLK